MKYSFFKRNGLLITFMMFMLITLSGQVYTGWKENNQQRQENSQTA